MWFHIEASGAGKSTLAAAFARHGVEHLADPDVQIPLGAIFVLDATGAVPRDRQTPTITRMPPAASVYRILKHAFNLDLKDRDHVSSQLMAFGDVATRVPVYSLTYPRLFDGLDTVIAAVQETVSGHSPLR